MLYQKIVAQIKITGEFIIQVCDKKPTKEKMECRIDLPNMGSRTPFQPLLTRVGEPSPVGAVVAPLKWVVCARVLKQGDVSVAVK